MKVEKKVYITGYSLWHYVDKEGRTILSEDSDGYQTWRVYEGKEPVYIITVGPDYMIEMYSVFTKKGKFIKDVRHHIRYYPVTLKK